MSKFKNKFRVESVRLKSWDYANQGAYFVTVCVKDLVNAFGDIKNEKMDMTENGKVVQSCWNHIPNQFPFVTIDQFCVMPNHIHGILFINKNRRDAIYGVSKPNPAIVIDKVVDNQTIRRDAIYGVSTEIVPNNKNPMIKFSLATVIRWFKGRVTHEINKTSHTKFSWQPRYFDRVIRNDDELYETRNYIVNNPKKWDLDKNNLANLKTK